MSEEQTTAQKLEQDQVDADKKATEVAREMLKQRNIIVDKLFAVLVENKINYSDFMHLINPALIDKVNTFIVTRDIQNYEISNEEAQEIKRRQVEALSK